jgi:hypothetical protein
MKGEIYLGDLFVDGRVRVARTAVKQNVKTRTLLNWVRLWFGVEL